VWHVCGTGEPHMSGCGSASCALAHVGFLLIRPCGSDHLGAGVPPPEAIGLTALEAARMIARTLALTCADCTIGGGGSGSRSAHVPDHHLSGLG
jgi:hypothetical protein